MASAQQVMEEVTNHHWQQSLGFKVEDKVWLNLVNICTDRPTKKLDAKHAKFTVLEAIGSHSYQLDIPPGIHDVFHSQLLWLALYNPLPSQVQDNSQPLPQLVGDEDEYKIKKILDEKVVQRGRSSWCEFLVKWTGYARPTWEPEEALNDAAALDKWEEEVIQTGRCQDRGPCTRRRRGGG